MTQASSIIGRFEQVDLPDLGIRGLRAKVDTGAMSSSLHVRGVEKVGRDRVRFIPLADGNRPAGPALIRKIARISRVRAGTAPAHSRIFIRTPIVLGPLRKTIELNLTDRRDYRFRMILGRTAIKNAFLVDVSRANVLRNWSQ